MGVVDPRYIFCILAGAENSIKSPDAWVEFGLSFVLRLLCDRPLSDLTLNVTPADSSCPSESESESRPRSDIVGADEFREGVAASRACNTDMAGLAARVDETWDR